MHLDGELFVVAAVRDITVRVAAEEELRRSEDALREAEQVVALAADRDRIARDLHDTVIQRLFATGMSLQGTVRLVQTDPPAAEARIEGAVDDLDLTVKHIRTAIFGLERARISEHGLRDRILSLIREAAGPLGFEPQVLLDGPIDTSVSDRVAAELLATLREALSNVARHAHATKVEVEVVLGDDGLCLRVVDDGVGPPGETTPRGKGLDNMAARAVALGGEMEIRPASYRGMALEWRVPKE
jgi:signal transduction histidine kinase